MASGDGTALAPRLAPTGRARGRHGNVPRLEPGDGLVRAGGIIFLVGVVAIATVFLAFAAGASNLPLPLDASAGIIGPLGFGLALAGLVRRARVRRGPS